MLTRIKKSLLIILFFGCVFLSFKQSAEEVKHLSMDFTSKILEKGKYVTLQGELYYDVLNRKMTTRITHPVENITIVSLTGEMKIYDPKENTVIYTNSMLNSTETSYFHRFFNRESSDMGLQKMGYLVKSTKIDEGVLVTTWVPKPGSSTPIKTVELAHEKSKPIYMSFISQRNRVLGKIYFSKYTNVGTYFLPFSITEFGYGEKGDSIINRKSYSNCKTNGAVNLKYLNYQIPENAKVVTVRKK